MDPPGQSGGGPATDWGSGNSALTRYEPCGIARPARRRPITWQFCFGAVPHTVQEHDCRGSIAAATARVHATGVTMMRAAGMRAAGAATTMRRKGGCFSVPRRSAARRRASVAIATGGTSIARTAHRRPGGDRCGKPGDATRRAAAAGSSMPSGRGDTVQGGGGRTNKVTHHGSPPEPANASLTTQPAVSAEKPPPPGSRQPPRGQEWVCIRCGRRCSDRLRQGFLHRRVRRNRRRGPDHDDSA